MRTITTKTKVYAFDELSEDVQQKVIEKYYDFNVCHEWWEFIYEDAKEIGIEITEFDLYRREINGQLLEEMPEVCKKIMADHGESTGTYQLAYKNKNKHGYDAEEDFSHELLQEYFIILQKEYDYLTSEEAIVEALKANDYEFTADGQIF